MHTDLCTLKYDTLCNLEPLGPSRKHREAKLTNENFVQLSVV